MARDILPILQTQLDGSPTAGSDCGVMSSTMAVAYGRGRRRGPNRERMRTAMGVKSGPTTSLDQKVGVESFGVAYRRKVNAPWARLVRALENGRWVNVQLDYSVVNARKPRLSGCRTFTGGHSVCVHGLRETEDGRKVRVFDPLYDGRAAGIPDGPRWWPLQLLKAAAGAFATDDHWTGGIIRAPRPEEPAKPDVDKPTQAELRQRIDILEEQVVTLRETLAVLDDTLEALEGVDSAKSARLALRLANEQLDEILPGRRQGDTRTVDPGANRETGDVDEDDED